MIDSIGGYATVAGCARMLGSTYWVVYTTIKRRRIPTVKLIGSPTVLVRVSDVAAHMKKAGAETITAR